MVGVQGWGFGGDGLTILPILDFDEFSSIKMVLNIF